MENKSTLERQIWNTACIIHEKYADKDLAHDAHEIWLMAGDCLKCLVVPFDGHPLARELMDCMVNYYCNRWTEANRHPENVQ